MEVKKLDFGETLKDSVAIGVKNAPSVIAAVALWLITILNSAAILFFKSLIH